MSKPVNTSNEPKTKGVKLITWKRNDGGTLVPWINAGDGWKHYKGHSALENIEVPQLRNMSEGYAEFVALTKRGYTAVPCPRELAA